jgi:opacity protein-like surface antigen
MARKPVFLLGLILFVSLAAQAQGDKVEVFGGYSYMRADNSPSYNTNGWEISGQYKFGELGGNLGVIGDFDGHYSSPFGVSSSIHTYLFGPQVSWPTRISPFAHLLIGGASTSSGGFSESSFAWALGGGIDARLISNVYWRVIQGDYLHTSFFGQGQANARLSTGIVIRF